MAGKAKEDIKKESERLYRLKAERLKRNPDFLNYMRRYYSIASCASIRDKIEKLNKIKSEIYKKYNIWVTYPPVDLNDWNKIWTNFDKPSVRIIERKPRFAVFKGKITRKKLDKFDRSIKIWDKFKERKPDEQIKRTLRDNKYLTLEIDTDMEKGVIISEIKNLLVWVKSEKVKHGLDKSPIRKRMDKDSGYLSVYDLKEKGWSWDKLARKFYKWDVERGDLSYAKRKVKRDYERGRREIYIR